MKRSERRKGGGRAPAESDRRGIVILDATVPLNFARIDRLDLLGQVPVPLRVGRIVATDELRHWPWASARAGEPFDLVAELGTSITVTQMDSDEELAMFARCREVLHLGRGECECVAIASARSWTVATDDGHARRILARHDVRVELTGTLGLLQVLVDAGLVTQADVTRIVEKMKSGGARLP